MNSSGILKQVLLVFAAAIVLYAVSYSWIEHRRSRNGPWEITFTQPKAGGAQVIINQPALGITNVQIDLVGAAVAATNMNLTLRFADARPVPFAVPLGQCVFQDTTFLPGTVVLNLLGHEVQLIPRVLTIDGKEHSWNSGTLISLPVTIPPPHPRNLQSPDGV